VAKQVELRIDGLGALLKDFRGLPKEATKELRKASVDIANRHMVPSWKAAALTAGNWGPKLAESIRARSDRLPALNVGKDRRAYTGGASTNMVRYPGIHGHSQRLGAVRRRHRLDGEAQAVPGASHPRVGPVRRPHRHQVE
jgi:hypothetical protein